MQKGIPVATIVLAWTAISLNGVSLILVITGLVMHQIGVFSGYQASSDTRELMLVIQVPVYPVFIAGWVGVLKRYAWGWPIALADVFLLAAIVPAFFAGFVLVSMGQSQSLRLIIAAGMVVVASYLLVLLPLLRLMLADHPSSWNRRNPTDVE